MSLLLKEIYISGTQKEFLDISLNFASPKFGAEYNNKLMNCIEINEKACVGNFIGLFSQRQIQLNSFTILAAIYYKFKLDFNDYKYFLYAYSLPSQVLQKTGGDGGLTPCSLLACTLTLMLQAEGNPDTLFSKLVVDSTTVSPSREKRVVGGRFCSYFVMFFPTQPRRSRSYIWKQNALFHLVRLNKMWNTCSIVVIQFG